LFASVGLIVVFLATDLVPVIGQSNEAAAVVRPEGLAALAEALTNRLPYVPGELLVRFRPDATATQQSSVLRLLRADTQAEHVRWIGDVLYLRNLDVTDTERAAETLARQPEVLYAHPNYIQRLQGVPNDTLYANQWNFPAINMPRPGTSTQVPRPVSRLR
jgi:hypothetical protein